MTTTTSRVVLMTSWFISVFVFFFIGTSEAVVGNSGDISQADNSDVLRELGVDITKQGIENATFGPPKVPVHMNIYFVCMF